VGAAALALAHEVADIAGLLRGPERPEVVVGFAQVADLTVQQLARIDVALLGNDRRQRTRVARRLVGSGLEGLQDRPGGQPLLRMDEPCERHVRVVAQLAVGVGPLESRLDAAVLRHVRQFDRRHHGLAPDERQVPVVGLQFAYDQLEHLVHLVLVPCAESRRDADPQIGDAVAQLLQRVESLDRALEVARHSADAVVRGLQPVERAENADEGLRAACHQPFGRVDDLVGLDSVGVDRQRHRPQPVVQDAREFRQILAQERLAAGEGHPQHPVEARGDAVDLIEGQFLLTLIEAVPVEAVLAYRVAPSRHEERQVQGQAALRPQTRQVRCGVECSHS
jgi:hypothetical protein